MHIRLISKESVPEVYYRHKSNLYSSDLGVGVPLVTELDDDFCVDHEMVIALVEVELDGMFFYLHYINNLEVMISFQEPWLNNHPPVTLLNSPNINKLFHRLLGPSAGRIVGSIDTPWGAYISASDTRIDYYLSRVAHRTKLLYPVYTPTSDFECHYWRYLDAGAQDYMETRLWKLSMEYLHYLRLLPIDGTTGGTKIRKLIEKSDIYYYNEPLVVDSLIVDHVVPTMFENNSRDVNCLVAYSDQGLKVTTVGTTNQVVKDRITTTGYNLDCKSYGMERRDPGWGTLTYQLDDNSPTVSRNVCHCVARLIHPNQRMYKHYSLLNEL